MSNKSLFYQEEAVLEETQAVIARAIEAEEISVADYAKLAKHYKKLLKQTKTLIKLGDTQQTQLNTRNAALLAQFLEAIAVGVFVIDAVTNQPYYANRQAMHLLGQQNPDEVVLDKLSAIYRAYQVGTNNLYPNHKLPIVRALYGESTYIDDIEIRRNDKTILLEVWGTPIFDARGKVNYAIAVFQDITQRKHNEAEKAHLTQTLEAQNQKLTILNEEKSNFLSIAAHDLKNPLSNIFTLTEAIQDTAEEHGLDDLASYNNLVRLASKQMFDLIKNLLDVNTIEEGYVNIKFVRIDIVPIVQRLLKEYRPKIEKKKIQIELHCLQPAYYVQADEQTLTQVFDNLISNALKYSPFFKKIIISCQIVEQHVHLMVQDQGPGLAPEEHARLFQKFARLSPCTTDHEHSTGLGLFIVKRLVEALHGSVWCETELGKGATFIVKLPRG